VIQRCDTFDVKTIKHIDYIEYMKSVEAPPASTNSVS
jgi:hypothetical protein